MIKTFTAEQREEAIRHYRKQRSAIFRNTGEEIIVFSPATEAIGHPSTIVDQG